MFCYFFLKIFFKHFSAFLVSQSFSHLVISQNRFLVVKIRTININIGIYNYSEQNDESQNEND